ncbi:MAG: type III pantothenate kinase [Bacteroidetes bacterium]|nr:type III pantothenate kinase [Bacteroidota bacterium]MCH8247014.1 type III pantothenate kinase [Bacteroidota bacterium]
MILGFDIGNSATKAAFFEREKCLETFTFKNADVQSSEHIEYELKQLAGRYDIEAVGCVSVVPAVTDRLEEVVDGVFGLQLQRLTSASPVPLDVRYETLETLGVDRLACAVASHILFGKTENGATRAVIALDAGTAVTTEVITADGGYEGGSIAPGPDLMRLSLNYGTAQLPNVEMVIPESSIGTSTDTAIRSGIMFGFLDSVQAMIRRTISVLDAPVYVVATGGWAEWLSSRIPEIDRVEPKLVLHGVRLMMEHGRPPEPS